MKSKSFEEKLRDWQAENAGLPEDAYLRVAATVFHTDLPARGKTRRELEQLRKRLRDTPGLMDKLRERGLLD